MRLRGFERKDHRGALWVAACGHDYGLDPVQSLGREAQDEEAEGDSSDDEDVGEEEGRDTRRPVPSMTTHL